jgi:hypothetical protein
MNPYDYIGGLAGASFGSFSYGTRLIIQYPATAFRWAFYPSATGGGVGAKERLETFLTTNKIGIDGPFKDLAPNSARKPGTYTYNGRVYQLNTMEAVRNFNGARAEDAEVKRIQSKYGSSIHGEIQTSRRNVNPGNTIVNGQGRARFSDIRYQTRSFLFGATDNFAEVKSYEVDLSGKIKVQAEADAANLKSLNAQAAPYRFLGQGLRMAGVVGLITDQTQSIIHARL